MYLAYSWIMTAKSAAACHFDFCSTLHARSPRSGRARSRARGADRRLVAFTSGRTKNPHSSPTCLIQKRCPLRTSLLTRIRSEWLYRPLGRPPLTLTRLTPSVRYSSERVAAGRGAKEYENDKNCTATTGEKRATRESHIVALCGYDPNATPEQICRTLIGKIDARSRCSQFVRALFDL